MTIIKYIHIFLMTFLASELSVASFSSGGKGHALYLAFGSLFIIFSYLYYSKSLIKSQVFIILFLVMTFYRMYEPQFWYLTLSSENDPIIGTKMKVLSLLQYVSGHLFVFVIGIFIRHRIQAIRRYDSLYISLLFTVSFWTSTSVISLDTFLPIYATPLINGVILPFALFNLLLLSLLFEFFKSLFRYKARFSFLYLGLISSLLLVNDFNSIKTNSLPSQVVAIAERSIVGDSDDFLENLEKTDLLNFKEGERLYIWPEARFVLNKDNKAKIESIREILLKKLPGTHLLGIFLVKNSDSSLSSNRYYKFSDSSSVFIKKYAPVPFQEDASLFWFIDPADIKMSFNVERGSGDNVLETSIGKFSVFMCNELMNVSTVLSKELGDFIISPSNPPLQLARLNEDLLNLYSKIIRNITNKTVLKVSSKQEISLFSSKEELITKEKIKEFL